jgi:hypothetical protein
MKKIISVLSTMTVVAMGSQGKATSLVANGNFETTTNGAGQLGYNTDATGWSTNGYNFLFNAGAADTTGASGVYGGLTLWGPHNGSANGLPAASPAGGNFVASDGAFSVAPITQTINGLTAGQKYGVGFYWAGAQQNGFDGPNTEQYVVSLGNQAQSTATYQNSSHGFSGWTHENFTFTATGGSEALSFLAVGTPDGVPPFALLDGVSMNAVPEPATWAMMILGIGGIGALARRRRAAGLLATAALA